MQSRTVGLPGPSRFRHRHLAWPLPLSRGSPPLHATSLACAVHSPLLHLTCPRCLPSPAPFLLVAVSLTNDLIEPFLRELIHWQRRVRRQRERHRRRCTRQVQNQTDA